MSDVRHQEPRGMKSPITIREVSTAEELKQAQEIRVRVLEEEQGFPREINIDGADRSASHVLVLDAGVPVATARLTITPKGQGRIARIAVLPAHRGMGLGRRLIQELETIGGRSGLHTLYVEPHAHLESFFRALGYETVEGSADIAGHYLIRMRKEV